MPFNLFKKGSRKSSTLGRTFSTMSKSSKDSIPTQTPLPTTTNPAPATRRPGKRLARFPINTATNNLAAQPATVANPFASSNSEAPPSYSPPETTVAASTDNPYAFLATFDTLFVIDDSGSMAGRSWRETSEAIASIAPICTAQDKDGIDIYFLNASDSPSYQNITRASEVQRIFETVRPGGGTFTGAKLNAILKPYLKECDANKSHLEKVKPLNIIVITDGVPSDDPESVIVSYAKKLDKLDAPAWQVGIQFFQVGEEAGAAEALQDLDDGIHQRGEEFRDIVDTVPWRSQHGGSAGLNADGILKVVLGAVNRRLDRKRVSLDGRPAQRGR